MSASIKQRLLRGFAAQGFGQVINLIIQVMSVRVFLIAWGKELYGEWLLLSTALGYLSVSDLSFGSAAQSEMTMRVGRGDRSGALAVFQSSWVLVTAISLVFMAFALLCSHMLPIAAWLKLVRIPSAEARLIVDLLILQIILGQQGGLITAAYSSDGHFAAGTVRMNLVRAAEFGVTVWLVYSRGRLETLAFAVLITRGVGYFLMVLDLRRRSPWLAFGWRHARREMVRPLVGPALAYNAFPLGYALSLQGVPTIIGHDLGAVAVTLFVTTRTLTRLIWQAIGMISNTVIVEISRAFGAHDIGLARSLHRRSCQLAVWYALALAAVLIVIGGPLYRFWTKGRVTFDAGLFDLLLLVITCSSLWSTSYLVPMSINRHQKTAAVFLAASALAMALTALLVRPFGVHGAAIALLAEEFLMTGYVVRHSLHLLEDDLFSYLRIVSTPPARWLWMRMAGVGRHE